MPAYVITKIEIHNHEAFRTCMEASSATIRKFGGHHIARGGEAAILERDGNALRNGIIQFASADDAQAWYSSPDYQEVKKLPETCSTAHVYALETD